MYPMKKSRRLQNCETENESARKQEELFYRINHL